MRPCLDPVPMNVDDSHPSSTHSPASAIIPSAAAEDGNQDDDGSDTEMSDLEAEIEQNFSSASPGSSASNDANEHGSFEAMDIDSEDDVKSPHVNKATRRVSTKEYYDPELFGLRRSVCRFLAPPLWWTFFTLETDPSRGVQERNLIDLCLM
jgi:hypothetical protein